MSERDGKSGLKRRGRHPEKALSDDFVREVTVAGRYCDGNCLYLDVQPSGSRSWVQRIVIRGRRREIGLGGVPLVPLDEVRARALANRKVARTGGDPLGGKQSGRLGKGVPTFAAAAGRVWRQMRPGWRNEKVGGDERAPGGDAGAGLARAADHGPASAAARRRGQGLGGRDGVPARHPCDRIGGVYLRRR